MVHANPRKVASHSAVLVSTAGVMADAQQLADEEAKVRAWAAARNITGDVCDVVIGMGFLSLEALACLDADDLRKSKVPVGQKKLLLRCVTRQLGGPANDRDDSGAQHSTRRLQRQSRRRPQREPLITRPAAATTTLFASCENNCRPCSRRHHRTRPPRRDAHQPPRLSHLVCCRGRILKFTCRTSAPLAPTSILLTLSLLA